MWFRLSRCILIVKYNLVSWIINLDYWNNLFNLYFMRKIILKTYNYLSFRF